MTAVWLLLGALCAEPSKCRVWVSGDAKVAAEAAVVAHGFTVAREADGGPAKTPLDDRLTVSAKEEKKELIVEVRSVDRPAFVGVGRTRVLVLKGQNKPQVLSGAAKASLGEALEALSRTLQEADSGKTSFRLSMLVNGLELKQRAHAEESLFGCLRGQFNLTGAVTTPEAKNGYLEQELEFLRKKGEPPLSLEQLAGLVRQAMLDGARAPCSTANTPLMGWSVRAEADPNNRAVRVSFKK